MEIMNAPVISYPGWHWHWHFHEPRKIRNYERPRVGFSDHQNANCIFSHSERERKARTQPPPNVPMLQTRNRNRPVLSFLHTCRNKQLPGRPPLPPSHASKRLRTARTVPLTVCHVDQKKKKNHPQRYQTLVSYDNCFRGCHLRPARPAPLDTSTLHDASEAVRLLLEPSRRFDTTTCAAFSGLAPKAG